MEFLSQIDTQADQRRLELCVLLRSNNAPILPPPAIAINQPATATHNKVLLRHHPVVNDALDAGLLLGASAYTESVTDWRQNQTKCDLASRTSSLQYRQLPASITPTQPTHPARKSLSFVSASRFLCFYCVLTKQRRSGL